jgi:squalene-hopene/tetraprenyl-beta-curcumene cyclase
LDVETPLKKAHAFLLSKQNEDGAWRSETYGALKSGYALTPVVLSALLFAPAENTPPWYDKGVDFLATLSNADGSLNAGLFGLDYPVYSLSGTILVLSAPSNTRHHAARDRLLPHLLSRQLDEKNGWNDADLSYGGWGYFFRLPTKPPEGTPRDELLASNVASTIFALGALSLAGVGLEDPAYAKARRFLERIQNFPGDGGFYFTPEDDIANKAGGAPLKYLSYGTATADGFRALLRAGVPRDDPRIRAAARWLLEHRSIDQVPGAYAPDREVQRDSAYFYWVWSYAHAMMFLGPAAPEGWARALAAVLIAKQAPDGSWKNVAIDLREDDPLVATSLALAALSICRNQM